MLKLHVLRTAAGRLRTSLPALLLIPAGLYLSLLAAPQAPARPAVGEAGSRIAEQVFLGEHAFGGLGRSEAEVLLIRLGRDLRQPPVDAMIDPSTRGKIPGLNGLSLDVPKTLEALLAAQPGDRIRPVFKEDPPAVGLSDLPPGPIYRGNPEKKAVSLLINVAWGDEYLPSILDTLRQRQTAGSFFLVGSWAEKHPETVKQIVREGHEIHSHGYGTPYYERLDAAGVREQVEKADQALKALTGRTPLYFSTHRGVVNGTILDQASRLGHETIMWSLDTVDWKNPGSTWIIDRIRRGLHPGALILMHPTRDGSAALPGILDAVEEAGLRVLPISRLLSPSRLE